MAMATLCQNVKKTTLLTARNLGRGLMGASSSLVAMNIKMRQYSAQNCTHCAVSTSVVAFIGSAATSPGNASLHVWSTQTRDDSDLADSDEQSTSTGLTWQA